MKRLAKTERASNFQKDVPWQVVSIRSEAKCVVAWTKRGIRPKIEWTEEAQKLKALGG